MRNMFFLTVVAMVVLSSYLFAEEPNLVMQSDNYDVVDGIILEGPKVLWRSVINNALSSGLSAPPFISGDMVYLFLKDNTDDSVGGFISAIDSSSGVLRWSKKIGGINVVPLFYEDTIYLGSSDGCFYAIDKATGKDLWYVKTDNWGATGSRTMALIDGELIYFGYDDGYLYAVNRNNGRLVWKHKSDGIIYSTPVINGDKLYYALSSGTVYALDKKNGKVIWNTFIMADIFFLNIGIYNNSLVIVWAENKGDKRYSRDKIYVTSINEENGIVEWKRPVHVKESVSWPLFLGDKIVMTFGKHLRCLDFKTGDILWSFESNNSLYPQVVVEENKLIVANGTPYKSVKLEGKNYLYAVSLDEGKVVWQLEIPSGINLDYDISAGNIILNVKTENKDEILFVELNGDVNGKLVIGNNEKVDSISGNAKGEYIIVTKDREGNSYIYKVKLPSNG